MVLAFAAACLSVDTAAFASPGARLPVVARARAAPPISMVAAKDVFAAYARRRALQAIGTAPPVARARRAVVGAAAAVGVLTPSSRLAVARAASPGHGRLLRLGKRLAEERRAAAAPAASCSRAGWRT